MGGRPQVGALDLYRDHAADSCAGHRVGTRVANAASAAANFFLFWRNLLASGQSKLGSFQKEKLS